MLIVANFIYLLWNCHLQSVNFYLCFTRYQKETTGSHLSPVKKRPKENTPPYNNNNNNHSEPTSTKEWSPSNRSKFTRSPQRPPRKGRQMIVISDTPSPAVSVITISSDSEDESSSQNCTPKGWVRLSAIEKSERFSVSWFARTPSERCWHCCVHFFAGAASRIAPCVKVTRWNKVVAWTVVVAA